MVVRSPIAAGNTQFTTDPSGAVTETGRIIPELNGMSGSMVRNSDISL